jgi:hypothetical protein
LFTPAMFCSPEAWLPGWSTVHRVDSRAEGGAAPACHKAA